MTGNALRHRLRPGGPWHSVLPGVYIAATGRPTVGQEHMAAQLYAGPGSVITGSTALRSQRLRGGPSELVDVLVPAARQRRDAAFVRLHRTTRMPGQVWKFGPLRYALPARAVADAVRGMDNLREVRAVVAEAVQQGRCEVRELAGELAAGPNIGSALFRDALGDVADGIRSAAEADLKDLLTGSGLPMPLFNPTIYAGDTFVACPDAWWPEFGIVLEVDSRQWHLSPEDHERTLERQTRYAKYLIVVLRFTPRQVRARPEEVLAKIRDAIEAARGRTPLNLRTVPTAA
jgi:hypothetical protein